MFIFGFMFGSVCVKCSIIAGEVQLEKFRPTWGFTEKFIVRKSRSNRMNTSCRKLFDRQRRTAKNLLVISMSDANAIRYIDVVPDADRKVFSPLIYAVWIMLWVGLNVCISLYLLLSPPLPFRSLVSLHFTSLELRKLQNESATANITAITTVSQPLQIIFQIAKSCIVWNRKICSNKYCGSHLFWPHQCFVYIKCDSTRSSHLKWAKCKLAGALNIVLMFTI